MINKAQVIDKLNVSKDIDKLKKLMESLTDISDRLKDIKDNFIKDTDEKKDIASQPGSL